MTRFGILLFQTSTKGTVTVRGREWITFEAFGASPARTLLSDSWQTLRVFRGQGAALDAECWAMATHPNARWQRKQSTVDSDVNPFTGRRKARHYMPAGQRDSQKGKLYAAERAAFPTLDMGDPTLRDLDACRALVQRWTAASWFRRRWGIRRIGVTHSGGRRQSQAGGGLLQMLTTHRNVYVLAHELAHCLAPEHGHGPAYARTYLDLVRYAIGRDAYDALKAAFRARRVRVAPRRPELDGRGVAAVRRAIGPQTGSERHAAAFKAAEAIEDRYAPVFAKLAADEAADPWAPRWPAPEPDRRLDVALALANGC